MTLKDLVKHIPAQRDAVNRLLKNHKSLLRGDLADWSRFKESVWGMNLGDFQEEQLVERGDDPVKDAYTLPNSLPYTHSVLTPPKTLPRAWNLRSGRILVRSEYYEAERAALLTNGKGMDAFVVTGQPGIGPSQSLCIACRI